MLTAGADVNFEPRDHHTIPTTALQIAVDAKNIGLAKLLLEKGAQPNAPVLSMSQPPILDTAIRKSSRNDLAMMTLLLDYGADPNFPNHPGRELPLYTAINLGHTRKVALLAARDADIHNRPFRNSQPPLHTAAFKSRVRTVRVLVDAGCDVNAVARNGKTPLMMAAEYASKETVQMLLDCGANPYFTRADGTNALFAAVLNAVKTQSISIMRLLLDYGLDVNSRDSRQRTPFLYALSQSGVNFRFQSSEALLQFGADVFARDEEGGSALHYAAQKTNAILIEWLCDHGADVNWYDNNDQTPMFWAFQRDLLPDKAASVKKLLDLGADPNHVNAPGQTPLLFAANVWCLESTQSLIEHGAKVNYKDRNGRTPLHYFATAQHPQDKENPVKFIELFISHGVDVNARTLAGMTALTMIMNDERPIMRKVKEVLIEKGATE
jgi:serine/threonine-protein phosphatase 6 regulatory ankyrin repeat subunit A